jgi:hypothetical protein
MIPLRWDSISDAHYFQCSLMSPPVDPVGQTCPLSAGALLCVPLSGPSISRFPLGGQSGPGALVASAVWAMIMGDAVRQLESPNTPALLDREVRRAMRIIVP